MDVTVLHGVAGMERSPNMRCDLAGRRQVILAVRQCHGGEAVEAGHTHWDKVHDAYVAQPLPTVFGALFVREGPHGGLDRVQAAADVARFVGRDSKDVDELATRVSEVRRRGTGAQNEASGVGMNKKLELFTPGLGPRIVDKQACTIGNGVNRAVAAPREF